MTEQVEQQICIKFCVKLEHSSVETIQITQKAFGNDAVSAVQIKVWHKRFKDGWDSVESDFSSGRPKNKQNTWECWTCTGCNQQRSAIASVELEADLGIPKTTVSKILMRDFGMKYVMASVASATRAEEHGASDASDMI